MTVSVNIRVGVWGSGQPACPGSTFIAGSNPATPTIFLGADMNALKDDSISFLLFTAMVLLFLTNVFLIVSR